MTPQRDQRRTLAPGLDAGSDAAAATDPPVPHAEVGEALNALDKAARSRRLYQPNNPLYSSFIRGAATAFAGLWDRVSALHVTVEETGFRWHGRIVAGGESREMMSHVFFKDGVRQLTFLPGFEDEVEPLLDVVNLARSPEQDRDDDMVTLLWQKEFACFHYGYVDGLADGLDIPQSRIPSLAGVTLTLVPDAELPAGEPARPEQPPAAVPPAVAAGAPTVAGLVSRDDFEATLYFLEPGELALLGSELDLEMKRDVKRDVLNALLDRIEDGYPEWRQEALRTLRQLLPGFLGAGDMRSAATVLLELSTLRERGVLVGAELEEVETLFRELSDPAVLTQLLHSLEDGSIDPSGKDLGIFLQHLGPTAMPILLAAAERSAAGPLQERLRTALEALAAGHRTELLQLLRHRTPDVVRGAARLCGRLQHAPAVPALIAMLGLPDEAMRRVAVEALVRIRNAPALDALQGALTDEDREVRIAACRGLAALRYPPARKRLQELLDSRLVREADLTEKIAFFEAYGAVADTDSVGMLDRMLNGRKLLGGREAPETRACAAMALGRVGSAAARTALDKAREDANPMVRNAVLKSLRQELA